MYQEISQLLMYGGMDEDEILYQMGQLFARFEKGGYEKMELVRDINTQVKRILKVATDYGFDDNLWHNYFVDNDWSVGMYIKRERYLQKIRPFYRHT